MTANNIKELNCVSCHTPLSRVCDDCRFATNPDTDSSELENNIPILLTAAAVLIAILFGYIWIYVLFTFIHSVFTSIGEHV